MRSTDAGALHVWRGRGIANKHHRSTGAGRDERNLHTFVMDFCFPSRGSQSNESH